MCGLVFFYALRLLSVSLYWSFILLSATFPSDCICALPLVSDVCPVMLLFVCVFLSCMGARALASDAVGCGMSVLITVSNVLQWDAAWMGRHKLLGYTYAE